jgi:hypothetical protein
MNSEPSSSESSSVRLWRRFWTIVFERVAKTPMPQRRGPRLARTDSKDITDSSSPDSDKTV